MRELATNAALLIIDVQRGFDDPRWGPRNNPGAEARIAELLAAWRATGKPVIHVRHDSSHPEGLLRFGTPANDAKPEASELADEPVHHKSVNSAFIGTALERELRRERIETLVIVGLTTNHCVSTTARMAGNLGFRTLVVSDATATFDRKGLDGKMRLAAEVHASALSDLAEEFAEIVDTATVINTLAARAA